ncbi:protease inhibitor I42 family protein [bacterium]|nr:protease inhibitor I42 family protein [bacterium]
MKIYPIICLFLILLAVLGGCKSSSKYVVLDGSKNGQTIKLQKGQFLVVKLKGNPTTGYIWEQSGECELLHRIKESEFEPESNLIGAPGTQTLAFRTVNTGRESLELVYHRPWEKGKEPIKTFSITIEVD